MREPVRSAPPPPGGRALGSAPRQTPGPINKRPVLEAFGGPGQSTAPLRPSRGPAVRPAPAQPPAARRQGVRPPPKKKPPPRPPPPKFQPAHQDRLPPSYEQVLQEDAAVLAGFGFGGSSSATTASASGDLIDFDAAVPAPALPPAATPITQDWASGAAWDAPAPAAVAAPAVTIIRPAKPGGGSRTGARYRAPAKPQPQETSESPPMPSMPPPPPPVLTEMESGGGVRPPTPPPRPGSSASSAGPDIPQATALYDFLSNESGDLSFKAGELVRLQERVNSEWLRGTCGGRSGMFPATFVSVTVPLPGEMADLEPEPATDGYTAEVLYDFAGQEPQDLSLSAGEHVQVLGRLNDEWAQGCVHGRLGSFPLAFVDIDASLLPLL